MTQRKTETELKKLDFFSLATVEEHIYLLDSYIGVLENNFAPEFKPIPNIARTFSIKVAEVSRKFQAANLNLLFIIDMASANVEDNPLGKMIIDYFLGRYNKGTKFLKQMVDNIGDKNMLFNCITKYKEMNSQIESFDYRTLLQELIINCLKQFASLPEAMCFLDNKIASQLISLGLNSELAMIRFNTTQFFEEKTMKSI